MVCVINCIVDDYAYFIICYRSNFVGYSGFDDDRSCKTKGGEIMKDVGSTLLTAIAKAGKNAAVKTCGAASYFYCYQPKEPAALKKFAKK